MNENGYEEEKRLAYHADDLKRTKTTWSAFIISPESEILN